MGAHMSGELFARRTVGSKTATGQRENIFFIPFDVQHCLSQQKGAHVREVRHVGHVFVVFLRLHEDGVHAQGVEHLAHDLERVCAEDFSRSQMMLVLLRNSPSKAASGPEFSGTGNGVRGDKLVALRMVGDGTADQTFG